MPGAPYETITEVVDCGSLKKTELKHDGKVWIILFWTTWCHFCEKPLT